jgi:hypothetical protein
MNQAAKTGQAQQVVSVDKHGITTTTVVQPPAAGQTEEAMTTTIVPPAAGIPAPKPLNPTISAVPQPPPEPEKVSIPAGTRLTIRVDQRISVKHSRPGVRFTGEIVIPVRGDDKTVPVPKGSPVTGIVDVAHRRGRFKGRSELELRLISLAVNGTTYRLNTRDIEETKKGKGKRSAAMIGGGTGAGMLVGGLATGGVGLAVGGLVGGGAGTATAALTGNRDHTGGVDCAIDERGDAGRAEAVVDIDHGDVGRAGIQHAQQRGHSAERRSIPTLVGTASTGAFTRPRPRWATRPPCRRRQ